jgi:hypothetical protein
MTAVVSQALIAAMDHGTCLGVDDLLKVPVVLTVDIPRLLVPLASLTMEFITNNLLQADLSFSGSSWVHCSYTQLIVYVEHVLYKIDPDGLTLRTALRAGLTFSPAERFIEGTGTVRALN